MKRPEKILILHLPFRIFPCGAQTLIRALYVGTTEASEALHARTIRDSTSTMIK